MEKIIIRPSSLASFVSCPRQWYYTFIKGVVTIPSARAAIGTGIHAGVEVMWKEAIKTNDKEKPNISTMTDAAIEAYDKEVKKADGRMDYGSDLDDNTSRNSVVKGTNAFVTDILPFTPIPISVEKRLTLPIKHCLVSEIGGTIDYLGDNTIADIKTSKRKVVPQSHVLQQSVYRLLAERNGYQIKHSLIQGVVLAKTKTVGGIDELQANIPQVKFIIKNLLARLKALYSGTDPELLFPGNPKHYLCSDQYCNLRSTCPFVHGKVESV